MGRTTSSLAPSGASELCVGASVINAAQPSHADEIELHPEEFRQWLFGFDTKYKYRPNPYIALQIEIEGIFRVSRQPNGASDLVSYGSYGYIDYRFSQQYNLGPILEYVRLKELHVDESEQRVVRENVKWRTGVFVGWAPIEETSVVRFAGHWTQSDDGSGFWEVVLQLVVSLGPHRPHNF